MVASEDYIYRAALKAGAHWPELVVAQWALESARGTKVSGRNNIAGLKGPGTNKTTTEYINGKPIAIKDDFLNFETVDDCVQYLVDRWYKDFKNHRGVNSAPSAIAAAKMLVSEGYATDPKYADKLIKIMSQQNQYADLIDAAKNFDGLPHQVKALFDLQSTLTVEQRKRFTDAWRSRPTAPVKPKFPLSVPYFWQRDSKSGQGERMCQSSAIAMRIEQIDAGIIGDDDSYLTIVNRYGDTVSQTSHRKALASLDLKAEFKQNGNEQLLCDLLDQGIAVPIGILHKGPISKPTGGGHWVTIIGYDEKFFHVHDPFGELDLINGGYPRSGPTDGKNVRYTRQNLMKRWLISSKSDGWLWIVKK